MGTGTGNKYGVYSYIPAGTGGTCYGIYSDARNSGDFAGYFQGRMYVSDKIGIGTDSPSSDLHIQKGTNAIIQLTGNSGTGEAWISRFTNRLHIASNDKIYFGTGGQTDTDVSINSSGFVGIGTNSAHVKLQIVGGSDASLSNGSGYFVVGPESGTNIVMDNNEILARNNGSGSDLYIQGSGTLGNTVINADSGGVGIRTTTPYVAHSTYGLTLPNIGGSGNDAGHAIAYAWQTYSFKKSKAQSTAVNNGLAIILKLNPVRFQEKGIEDVGFDPEELYKLVPNAATLPPRTGIYKDVWAVNTNKVIPLLVNAIQQQQQIIDQQNKVVDEQNKKIDNLKKRLERLEKLIEKQ